MITVGRLAPADQWDQTMLDDLFDNKLYPTGIDFSRHEGYPNSEGCVLIIPGRYWHNHTDQISEAIQRYSWVLGIRTGDEEDQFDPSKVEHPQLKWWLQTPRRDYQAARLFGVGYSPHFRDLPTEPPSKSLDVYLAAQKSNALTGRHFKVYERRAAFFKALKRGAWQQRLVERDGFAQGDRDEYLSGMLSAKVAPAPTGMVSVDSIRFWEALEAHCIPIADMVSDVDGLTDYWQRLFGGIPFSVITDVADLPLIVDEALKAWPANRVTAWYMTYKRQLARWLRDDLEALGAL